MNVRFEVSVNGKRLCTAGLDSYGVLSAVLSSVERNPVAEAKLCIQASIREGSLELAWSYILDYENDANPFEERLNAIAGWRRCAAIDTSETDSLLQQARLLGQFGLKAKDALHVACAMSMGCDYFVTTDDAILHCGRNLPDIVVIDPPSLIRELDL